MNQRELIYALKGLLCINGFMKGFHDVLAGTVRNPRGACNYQGDRGVKSNNEADGESWVALKEVTAANIFTHRCSTSCLLSLP